MFKKLFNRKIKKYESNILNHNDKECDKTCCFCHNLAYKFKQCQNCNERKVCKTCYYGQDKILCKDCDKDYIRWQKKLEKIKEQQENKDGKSIFIIGDEEEESDYEIEYSLSKSLDIEHSYTDFLNVAI